LEKFPQHRYCTSIGERLKDLRLAVVGAGTLGSELSRLLAENSFSKVLLIDPDRLEPHNVALSSLYRGIVAEEGPEAFTRYKTELIVDWARQKYSLTWESFAAEIADAGLGRLALCDLVISCTDSTLARVETALAARVLNLPMLDSGVRGEGIPAGRVSWFSPSHEAACYLCGISEIRRAELLSYALSTSLGCGLPAEAPAMTGAPDAVRETAAAMLELIQSFSADKHCLKTSFSSRIEWDPTAQSWIQKDLKLPRSVTCPWHDLPEGEWLPLGYDQPIRDSLHRNNMRVQLLWPHCLEARCRVCGHQSTPNLRVARLRRKAVCAQCGTIGSYEPTRIIDSVGDEDFAADFTPRQLGLPKQHLYLFRRVFAPMIRRKDVDEPVA
jgi:molybdopterin/thiamine biosynthesis adenylyltransferase